MCRITKSKFSLRYYPSSKWENLSYFSTKSIQVYNNLLFALDCGQSKYLYIYIYMALVVVPFLFYFCKVVQIYTDNADKNGWRICEMFNFLWDQGVHMFLWKEKQNFCIIPACITCSKSTTEIVEQCSKCRTMFKANKKDNRMM